VTARSADSIAASGRSPHACHPLQAKQENQMQNRNLRRNGAAACRLSGRFVSPPDHFRLGSRRFIALASVNTNTSSPVIVLMSWCMLTHRRPVDSCTNASIREREVSIR